MSSAPVEAREIFTVAVEQYSPEQWSNYLDEACANNPEVRKRVELLLEAHMGEESILNGPAIAAPPTLDKPLTELPGTLIGPYKLLQQIGEGGMGVVYMAEQTEPVTRRVALKIIKPGMDSRQVIARFEAERQALAVMDHPNIAKVADAGTTESGRPYFVMELVKGIPITQYCDQHKLSVRERLELFVPVCQAIQHAHQKGIIHRDIKPSNVLVARYDDRPVPKIIDFGVAKATQQKLTEKTVFTQFGQIVGTFEYMSPEQAQLNQLDIDTRSDVYSLGVLLYELLIGQTPFDGERLRSAAFDELLRILREEDPPRPSTRLSTSGTLPEAAANRHVEPKRLSSLVRGELDWIVMKALEKDRTRRYETATALAADVEHYLNDEPVEACPPSSIYLIGKFARRNKGWLSTAAVVLLTVLVGLTVSTVLIARERDAAKMSAQSAKESARKAEQSARREAVVARQAEQRLDDARYNLYVAHTRLARGDWENGHVERMVETLEGHIPQQGERELRGWEWYYLMSLPRHDLATMTPDVGPIINVKWSTDRRYLAAAGDIIVVYDALTNETLFQIRDACHFAWSPTSHEIAITSYDGKVSVWDADQKQKVRSIGDAHDMFKDARHSMIWSPDGSLIAVTAGIRLHVWPAGGSGEAITVDIDKRLGIGLCLDWSPNGRFVAIGGGDSGWVEIYDIAKRQPVLVEGWHGNEITGVAWSPDGSFLASACRLSHVNVRETTDWHDVLDLEDIHSAQHDLEWSPDGKHIAGAGNDGRVSVWNAQTGTRKNFLRGHRGPIQTLDWSADGQQIATGSFDGTVKVWAPFAPQEFDTLDLQQRTNWSPDGRLIAGFTESSLGMGCSIYSTSTRQRIEVIQMDKYVYGIDFSPDCAKIALALDGGGVGVWKVDDAQQLWVLPDAHRPNDRTNAARCVDWGPDGRVLATCGMDRTVKLWDGASGELLRTLKGHEVDLGAVVWSPDGSRLVSTDWQCHVKIWNTNTWTVEHHMVRNPQPEFSADGSRPIALTNDGNRLAGGGTRGIIYVWDVASGRELLQLHGHTGNIRSVAWAPDNRRLASAGEDGLVKVWDATSGREMLSFKGHDGWVTSVDWSPDGRRLMSSAKETLIWDATAAYEAYEPPRGHVPTVLDRHLGKRADGGENVATVDVHSVRDTQNDRASHDDTVPSNDARRRD